MKKLLISLFVLIVLVVIAGVGSLYYVKPDQNLDLVYEEVPLKDRALDMVRRMSPELILTSEDINNLSKKSIADNPQVEKDVLVTGADFNLDGDLLLADLNVIWKDQISAGLKITYRLHWNHPNVVATVEKAMMKGITLPNSMFSDRIIPIGEDLPKLLKINKLEWGGGEVKVKFQKPSLSDLRELIG
ncbi:hypothetical protein [Cohnella sp. WQ 127256]|uniref:hypothetical protein n=1 Tax=Cohnella sp. WQ 127256 TaxID=2938790 RepID=UPI0021186637|nr:hypothetical protein [Cohnella sp. WQ 127256]